MKLVDYHNVIVIDYLMRNFRNGRKKLAVTAWTVIDDTNDDLEIDVEPEDIEASLRDIFGELNIVETPHASPRFIVEKPTLDGVLEGLKTTHSETRRAMTLTSDLGWGWLGESIEGAAEELEKSGSVAPEDVGGWEPLAIERPDADALDAAQALSALADQVKADNGYAATAPVERSEVVRRLGEAADWLRNAEYLTVSAVQTYLIWPLETLAARFSARTTIGKTAQFAAGIVAAWLKSHGIKVLDKLIGE